jgi:hypothetical protein
MRSLTVLALSAVASAIKTNSRSQVAALTEESIYDKAYELAL